MAKLFAHITECWRLWRAEALLSQGRLLSAARHLALVPGGRGKVWRLKGRLFARAGLPVAAVKCLFEAVRNPGSSLEDVLELAYGLVQARDFHKAERVLHSYLSRVPHDSRAQRLLAHIYRAQGRMSTALQILRQWRPHRVVAKYSHTLPPALKLAWRPEKAWLEALSAAGLEEDPRWSDPATMALDADGRDDLLCLFYDLSQKKGGLKALAYGVGKALESDEAWLMPWIRKAAVFLKLDIPKDLPMFVARHGKVEDKALLLAGLATGGEERVLSAAALMALGFDEYAEVLDEMKSTKRRQVDVPQETWRSAKNLLSAHALL